MNVFGSALLLASTLGLVKVATPAIVAIAVLEVRNSRRLIMIVLVSDFSSRLAKDHIDQFSLLLFYRQGGFSSWHMIWNGLGYLSGSGPFGAALKRDSESHAIHLFYVITHYGMKDSAFAVGNCEQHRFILSGASSRLV